MWKPQFLKKLSDSVYIDEYDDAFEESGDDAVHNDEVTLGQHISLKDSNVDTQDAILAQQQQEMSNELMVDVYQTPDEIVVRTMIAGVKPHNIDIALTRDMVTITGSKEDVKEVTEDDYFYRELSWGSFTRTIMLPAEVEVDEADAQERHGVLTLRLPKINKERQAKIKVKSN
ncbi:MAG: Hsp20/alpha crystallin family protein [Candidatus Pacebacteria bacterium]|nr:Hsp20/alpha crystallin family protein [Candidatus Paceibacterota bacterium]